MSEEIDLGLTPKQEKFTQVWFSTSNKSEAYRQAYDAENSTEKSIWQAACRLSKNVKVAARFEQLKQKAVEQTLTTVVTVDRMLKVAYDEAKTLEQSATMVSAARSLAKLHGLNQPDKIETNHSGSLEFDSKYMKKLAESVQKGADEA